MNTLEQLKQYTSVVADTGDVASIAKYQPDDATTNPSLILKALQNQSDGPLISEAKTLANQHQCPPSQALTAMFGQKISQTVPGFVSTEVDPRMSFDTQGTIAQAQKFIELYQALNVDTSRILIKIAATWEGIKAAKTLEQQGIKTNITLLFSKVQAMAAAQSGATLISPFVGRILDWYKKNQPEALEQGDPGVLSVKDIYQSFKHYGYDTIVMGASFRNVDEIIDLAGCDKLTISPALLDELQNLDRAVERQLTGQKAATDENMIDESTFRWQLNENAMATEKLAEGIRLFSRDIEKLETLLD